MTWIYSFVVAGLIFSNSSDAVPTAAPPEDRSTETAAPTRAADEIEKFEQTYPLTPNGRVSVANVNGSIEIVAWDRSEVRLEATKIADSKESLAAVDLKIDARADSFSVETEYERWNWKDKSERNRSRRIEVQFKLSVPRGAMLNEIETVNGSVTARDFVNYTKISAVNGDVNAANLRGTASLSTVNGTVVADFDRLDQGSKIDLSTVNGRINLSIPSDANATIKADSLNGSIVNGFGLPVRKGEYVGRDLHGRLGSGDVQIKLNSVNGPLAINKKDDGKPQSPATNLLPAKGSTDNWDDGDDNVSVNAARMNRDIARAVRDAERVSVNAAKEAKKAMENIKLTDLEKLKIDIDGRKLEEEIKAGLKEQSIALDRMRDAMWLGGMGRVERRSKSLAVTEKAKITIDAGNFNVKVRGWDRPEVKYVLTEFPRPRMGQTADVKEEQNGSSITLKITGGRDTDSGWFPGSAESPRLEVYVPRKSDLKINTKGEIRLEGVTGDLELIGDDNSIDVRGSDGKLTVSNTDGVVRIIGFSGELAARTDDGEVYMEGDFRSIDGRSADGKFVLTIPENIDADIQAPSEAVTISGLSSAKRVSDSALRLGKGGRSYKFVSADGRLEVRNRDLVTAER